MKITLLQSGVSTRPPSRPILPWDHLRRLLRLWNAFALLCVLGMVLGRTSGAEFIVPFPEGTNTVKLPRFETGHRLYLKATATESIRLRFAVLAGMDYAIGQFHIPASTGSESPEWIPLTDAAGAPVVLAPYFTTLGAEIRYWADTEGPVVPRLLELKAVTTTEEPDRAYVAWVKPSPGSFGNPKNSQVVIELAPGRTSASTPTLMLDQRPTLQRPSGQYNSINGVTITYPFIPGMYEFKNGQTEAEVQYRDRSGTLSFNWSFHVGNGPGVYAAPTNEGGLDLHFVGSLESAPSPAGPFKPVVNAVSPHRIGASEDATAGYFRAVQ